MLPRPDDFLLLPASFTRSDTFDLRSDTLDFELELLHAPSASTSIDTATTETENRLIGTTVRLLPPPLAALAPRGASGRSLRSPRPVAPSSLPVAQAGGTPK